MVAPRVPAVPVRRPRRGRARPVARPRTARGPSCCSSPPRSSCRASTTAASRSGTRSRSPSTCTSCGPTRGCCPPSPRARAHCRSICGRDALGLREPPLRAADEPQGAPPRLPRRQRRAGRRGPDRAIWRECLARARRPVPLRRRADRRRRDVRAGVRPLRHLRRRARRRLRRATATRSWACRRWSSGPTPRAPSRTRSRSSRSSSDPAPTAARRGHHPPP